MLGFGEFIKEARTNRVRDALATLMVGGGLLNTTGITPQEVPPIVYDYWQKTLAPTNKQQIYALSKKYEKHATRDERGRRVLNIDKIADNEDRTRFQRLITQAEP